MPAAKSACRPTSSSTSPTCSPPTCGGWANTAGQRCEQLYLDGLPDLVIEIRSPSTWIRDLRVKLPRYEAAGVPEAWYVDTEARMVLVFRRSRADAPAFDVSLELGVDQELTSPLLPEFALPVGQIFG